MGAGPATDAEGVLAFVFVDQDLTNWFTKDADFDAEVRRVLGPLAERGWAGDLDDWVEDARSALALVILLDQVPRNLFRDDPRSFAHDAKALEVSKIAIEAGHDRTLADDVQRAFLYMPFQHCETLDDQRRSVGLFKTLADDMFVIFAVKHFALIERFGRFPHRNACLGRANTDQETIYLQLENAGF